MDHLLRTPSSEGDLGKVERASASRSRASNPLLFWSRSERTLCSLSGTSWELGIIFRTLSSYAELSHWSDPPPTIGTNATRSPESGDQGWIAPLGTQTSRRPARSSSRSGGRLKHCGMPCCDIDGQVVQLRIDPGPPEDLVEAEGPSTHGRFRSEQTRIERGNIASHTKPAGTKAVTEMTLD